MILDYTVPKFNKPKEKELKNKTKLSMQSLVSQALASKMPTNPAQMPPVSGQQGWGKSN